MNVIHENFVGIYEGIFTSEFCQSAINYFEDMKNAGFVYNRQQVESVSKTSKEDESVYGHDESVININYTSKIQPEINSVFWNLAYKDYASVYPVLEESGKHASYASKIQKTKIGGGYHIWHYEAADRASCNRLLTWILYLNDVEEGGETEFLYFPKRIKPKAGTLLIFPAAYTHTHRGNPPISNEKYIITGWSEF